MDHVEEEEEYNEEEDVDDMGDEMGDVSEQITTTSADRLPTSSVFVLFSDKSNDPTPVPDEKMKNKKDMSLNKMKRNTPVVNTAQQRHKKLFQRSPQRQKLCIFS